MENEGERLNLVFGERIKGDGGKDKRKFLGKREGTFEERTFGLLNIFEILRKEKTREKRERKEEKEEQVLAKTNIFWRKERKSCIPISSHTQIISEGEVRSLISVYNK